MCALSIQYKYNTIQLLLILPLFLKHAKLRSAHTRQLSIAEQLFKVPIPHILFRTRFEPILSALQADCCNQSDTYRHILSINRLNSLPYPDGLWWTSDNSDSVRTLESQSSTRKSQSFLARLQGIRCYILRRKQQLYQTFTSRTLRHVIR